MAPSNNRIQKVAIVGASGNCGGHITEHLLKTGKHEVTAITRPDSTNTPPQGVEVRKANYDDTSALVEALKGHDAFIITMSVMAPPDSEKKLVDAAIAAGVPFILPNEWGLDNRNEGISKDTMIGDTKKNIRSAITQSGTSSFIAVVTGFWYEWSIAYVDGYGIDFKNQRAMLYDDGEQKINTSTWPQVGRAVASLLSLPVESEGGAGCVNDFKNDFVYISSFELSQKDMLESAARVTGTKLSDWEVTYQPSHERYQTGRDQLASGDRRGFIKSLYARPFYPDGAGNFAKTRGLHNKLLGLPDNEDLDSETKLGRERALGANKGINAY